MTIYGLAQAGVVRTLYAVSVGGRTESQFHCFEDALDRACRLPGADVAILLAAG